MDNKGLSPAAEKLLYKIVDAINPTQMLGNLFKDVAPEAKSGLRRLVKELQQYGYIDVAWVDNFPCMVSPNSSAIEYIERLAEYKEQKASTVKQGKEEPKPTSVVQEVNTQQATSAEKVEQEKPIIFISHSSKDKKVAEMLADFFFGTGIPRETVFCSSLPGNDVNYRISDEVKTAIKNSIINVAILSMNYFKSAYCLNEAGIMWYRDDVPVVLVALPGINEKNIKGFFDKHDILRRLNSNTDISIIYGAVRRAISAAHAETVVIVSESNKLMEKYAAFLKTRPTPEIESAGF